MYLLLATVFILPYKNTAALIITEFMELISKKSGAGCKIYVVISIHHTFC